MPPFDTLALTKVLEQAGFPRSQAEALTVALARIAGEVTAARPSPDTDLPAEIRRELLTQQTATRVWINRAMTVLALMNVLAIAVAAGLAYVALEPSLTPSPATLAALFPAIVAVALGVCGLVVAQLI